jgi:hypothetical protein
MMSLQTTAKFISEEQIVLNAAAQSFVLNIFLKSRL